jgi:hypothetical protein
LATRSMRGSAVSSIIVIPCSHPPTVLYSISRWTGAAGNERLDRNRADCQRLCGWLRIETSTRPRHAVPMAPMRHRRWTTSLVGTPVVRLGWCCPGRQLTSRLCRCPSGGCSQAGELWPDHLDLVGRGRGDVDRDAEVVQVQGGLDGHRAGGQLVRNLHGHRVAGCRGAADLLLTDDADLAGDGLQVPQCLGRVARAVIGQRAEAWPEPAPPASSLGSSSLVHGLWCSSGIGGPPGPYGRRSGRRPPWLPVLAATSSPAKIVRWVIASLALSASVTLSAAPWARASASSGVAVRSSTAALAQPASTRAASATPIETTWVLVRAASGTPSLRSGADGAQERNRLSLPLPKQRKETLVAPVEAGRDPGRPDVARRWRSWGGADSLVVDRARWGASGALYPQSAPAGLNPCPRVRVRRSAPGTEC